MRFAPIGLPHSGIPFIGAIIVGVFHGTLAYAQDATNPQSSVAQGRKVYMEARCFACHGEFGFGGAGPRFRGDRFLGLTSYVVGQILIGRDIMPPFEDVLDNAQIAEVASYIRTSWGNDFGDVKPAQVAQIRQDVKLHPPPQGQLQLPPSPPPAAAPEPPPNSK